MSHEVSQFNNEQNGIALNSSNIKIKMSESKHTEMGIKATESGECYDKRTIENTDICIPCGNIFVQEEDYDTGSSESGVCCPDCGAEKFVSVKSVLDQRDALLNVCKAIKIRIAYIGLPSEPKDWSKEIALIEAAEAEKGD